MSFNSFVFWLIFPGIFLIHWLLPDRIAKCRPRNLFLLIVSYIFYANWKPAYMLILLAVTLLTYVGALLFESKESFRKSWFVSFIIVLALIPLLVFKYYNFINESIWNLLSSIGLRYELRGLNLAIPVGISFYTFQALGYLFDVYYKKAKAERSFIDYALFVCFFPQIVSGPISKTNDLIPQIKKRREFNYSQGVQGLKFLLWGMFLKLVLADRLGLYVDKVYDNYLMYNGSTCFLSTIFYSFQIYGDFAGYSLMAVGIAKTLGFDLVNNFKQPYFSVSITDFWHRWHISLSTWLRDYVYIPLGGSRCSRLRNYWNILATFLVSGIWHGANWTYIVWGGIHGLVQVVEKAFGLKACVSRRWCRILRICITFIIVDVAWVFFRMPTLSDSFSLIGHSVSSLGIPSVLSLSNFSIGIIAIVILLLKDIKEEYYPPKWALFDKSYAKWIEYVFLFCMILLCGVLDSGTFIYGSF